MFLLIFADSLAGHDVHDSTTVIDKFTPRDLPDSPSVQGLHIGIPKVQDFIKYMYKALVPHQPTGGGAIGLHSICPFVHPSEILSGPCTVCLRLMDTAPKDSTVIHVFLHHHHDSSCRSCTSSPVPFPPFLCESTQKGLTYNNSNRQRDTICNMGTLHLSLFSTILPRETHSAGRSKFIPFREACNA